MSEAPLPVVRTVSALRARVAGWRTDGRTIALVPTMGALHEGHLSLVRMAREHADRVVASLFVNPTQFGPNEDFAVYPRSEASDAALLADVGCDLLYAPAVEEMYPEGFASQVSVTGVSEPLDGAARPGHFDGVATVVTKLLLQAAPDVALFGEKDYQQLQVIRRLVRDLDIPVEVVGAPIVRDQDGLALSSRNAYLDAEQKRIAVQLNQVLKVAVSRLRAGEPVAEVEETMLGALEASGFDSVDYVEVRSAADLARLGPGPIEGEARILAAVRLGKTRLIDNMAV